jgi:hypothetical protein
LRRHLRRALAAVRGWWARRAPQEADEQRVLAALLAGSAPERWALFGAESAGWRHLEPVLSARLLVAAEQRASCRRTEREELAWLAVLLLLRLREGELAEGLQRNLLGQAFLLLAELSLDAGEAAAARRRLRLAHSFLATGTRSPGLRARYERLCVQSRDL